MKTTGTTNTPIPLDPSISVPLLLDEEKAAALLSLSSRKLWELASRGAIKFVKIGALKRYRRVDLEDWVARRCPTDSEST
jgi:excisionase family DNA binding protein